MPPIPEDASVMIVQRLVSSTFFHAASDRFKYVFVHSAEQFFKLPNSKTPGLFSIQNNFLFLGFRHESDIVVQLFH